MDGPDLREVVETAMGLGFDSHAALMAANTVPAQILLYLGTAAAIREAREGAFEYIGEAQASDSYPNLLADILLAKAEAICGRDGLDQAIHLCMETLVNGAVGYAKSAMDEAFDRVYRGEGERG